MSDSSSFTVARARAAVDGLDDLAFGGQLTGTTWTSTGTATATSKVQVDVNVAGVRKSGTGSFSVTPRTTFPAPQIGSVSVAQAYFKGPIPVGVSLGVAIFDFGKTFENDVKAIADSVRVHIDSATSGPNTGTAFLTALNLSAKIFINADLYSNETNYRLSFKADQNGTDGTSSIEPTTQVRYCNAADMPGFVAEIERHEGKTLDSESHVGVFNTEFAKPGNSFTQTVEKKVFKTPTSLVDLLAWANGEAFKAAKATEPAQKAFHDRDGQSVESLAQHVGCAPDLNPTNP